MRLVLTPIRADFRGHGQTDAGASMADWEVTDELWARIRPLLPVVQRRRRHPGRRRLDDRACLNGVLFVLVTGMRWDRLPVQLGYGSGVTCWRRLRAWTQAGVWDRLHELLLAELHGLGRIDWSRAAADASHIRAKRGDDAIGPSPVDRRRPGSKHHALVDGSSLPLAVALTGGNRHDSTRLIELVDAVPAVRGRRGRPRRRPDQLATDRAYDAKQLRHQLRARGIRPLLARRGVGHGSGLGRGRWVVERFFGWLHNSYRRLATRWEYRADIHLGFMKLACCLICWRRRALPC